MSQNFIVTGAENGMQGITQVDIHLIAGDHTDDLIHHNCIAVKFFK